MQPPGQPQMQMPPTVSAAAGGTVISGQGVTSAGGSVQSQVQGPPGAVQPGQPQQPIRVYFQQSQDPTAIAQAAAAAQQQQPPNTNPVFVHHPSANFVVGFLLNFVIFLSKPAILAQIIL